MSPPLISGPNFVSSLIFWNASGVTPAAIIAAVIEPTDAPWICLAPFSTPLSVSAFTAPGSAAPLPPPREKVISVIGGGSRVRATRPSEVFATVTSLPPGPVQTFGSPTGAGTLIRAPGRPGPWRLRAGPTALVQTFGSPAASLMADPGSAGESAAGLPRFVLDGFACFERRFAADGSNPKTVRTYSS